jgi:hypothetical protein
MVQERDSRHCAQHQLALHHKTGFATIQSHRLDEAKAGPPAGHDQVRLRQSTRAEALGSACAGGAEPAIRICKRMPATG